MSNEVDLRKQRKVDASVTIDTTGLATEAKQDDIIDALGNIEINADSINLNTDGLETLIGETNTKLDTLNSNDFATEVKQDSQITLATTLNTYVDSIESLLTTLNAKDFATQTTLDLIRVSIQSIDADFNVPLSTRASQDTLIEVRDYLDNVETHLLNIILIENSIFTKLDTQLDVTLSSRLSKTDFEARINTLGQKISANSTPVVLASDQTLSLPSGAATSANQSTEITALGSLTETAPATDTASSGLNGRLQRIAQRITSLINALGNPFQVGGVIGNTAFGITNWLGSTAPTIGQKTSANSIPVTIASDQTINVTTTPSSSSQTYCASVSGFVCPAAATDVFTIQGSATKTISITRIIISGTTSAGSGASISMSILKRSTANTGGTSITLTNVKLDTNNANATAVVKNYTANATVLGTLVGNLISERMTINTAGALNDNTVYDFGNRTNQPIVLRGINEFVCINFGSATITNPIISISIEFTES
jgi:hypothetical protein